jgi:hypothetical protein
VRADLRDPKIGILDPKIQLYAYATMAELERALPALLDTLAKGTSSAETIGQPQGGVSSLCDKQTVASDPVIRYPEVAVFGGASPPCL